MMMQSVISSLLSLSLLAPSLVHGDNNTNAPTPTPHIRTHHRLGIVFSQTSSNCFWSDVSYAHMFLASQDAAIMAGIPFDLLDESDLTNVDNLKIYDALLMHSFRAVSSDRVDSIIAALDEAIHIHGVSIIASAGIMVQDEQCNALYGEGIFNPYQRMSGLLGMQYAGFKSGVKAEYKVFNGTHPTMSGYETGDEMYEFDPIWFDYFSPVDPSKAEKTAEFVVEGESVGAVYAVTGDTARHVHFAEEWSYVKGYRVWAAIRWVLFGTMDVPNLAITRNDGIFFARNDMDLTGDATLVPVVHTLILDIITEWKEDYNFVGSFYINNGNDPARNLYTDWEFAKPLYDEYMDLGNEIGTHSYTHPHYTSRLTYPQLEFEFNQHVKILEEELSLTKVGGAVPGNPEPLRVPYTLNPWLDYLCGAIFYDGVAAVSGFGQLRPDQEMIYHLLNMSPDFTLLGFLKLNETESDRIWDQEFDYQMIGTDRPIYQWMWHDYAPGFVENFTIEPMTKQIARAYEANMEFVTGADLYDRFRNIRAAEIKIHPFSHNVEGGDNNEYKVELSGSGYGKLAIGVPEGKVISEVIGWYAYDSDQVLTRDTRHIYHIKMGTETKSTTRITSMPMRSNLILCRGNGYNYIRAEFFGEGDVHTEVKIGHEDKVQIYGGDYYVREGNVFIVTFLEYGDNEIKIRAPSRYNRAPIAVSDGITINTDDHDSVDFVLEGQELDRRQTLSYRVLNVPTKGILTGVPPYLTYHPYDGEEGTDILEFEVSDNQKSDTGTFEITIQKGNSTAITDP